MKYILIILSLFFCVVVAAQEVDTLLTPKDSFLIHESDVPSSVEPMYTDVYVKGKMYSGMIVDGDTLILADLDDVSITSFRKFENEEERRKYMKMRRYAAIVYPYAKEGIRIFREVEYASEHLSKKERKKRIKELEKELKREFEKPLSKLTKLQGKILIKMIEKETGDSFYNLTKKMKGRFTAFYWHQFSKLYSYDLKEGYQEGKYKILDAVLQDFDLTYRIEHDTSLKYISINNVRNPKKTKG